MLIGTDLTLRVQASIVRVIKIDKVLSCAAGKLHSGTLSRQVRGVINCHQGQCRPFHLNSICCAKSYWRSENGYIL
jgi:hypothetical protein